MATASATARPFDLLPYLRALGEIAKGRIAGVSGDVYLPHDAEELRVLEAARKFTALYPDGELLPASAHRSALRLLRALFRDWFQGTKGQYERFLELLAVLDGPQKLQPFGYLLGDDLLLLKEDAGDAASRPQPILVWRRARIKLTPTQFQLLRAMLETDGGSPIDELGQITDGEQAARTALTGLKKRLVSVQLTWANVGGGRYVIMQATEAEKPPVLGAKSRRRSRR